MSRRISSITFNDGAVISAERLDAVWDAVVQRFNALELQDVARQWWEQQAVFGYQSRAASWNPSGLGHPYEAPWLRILPQGTDVSQFKGSDFPGLYPGNEGYAYVWATSWYAATPQVLTAFDLCLDTASDDWKWIANPPDPLVIGDWLEDVAIEILVDSPTDPGNAHTTSIVSYRGQMSVGTHYVSPVDWTSDMLPAFPDDQLAGLWIHAKGNYPIPAGSRVRVAMVVPDYTGIPSIGVGDVRWVTTVNAPWALQSYSGSATFLIPRTREV